MSLVRRVMIAMTVTAVGVGGAWYLAGTSSVPADQPAASGAAESAEMASPADDALRLGETQVRAFEVGPVGTYSFPVEKEAVGSIDFNEDMAVQVFPPYAGRIIEAYAKLGDAVRKGQVLFTIESPDLINAENTLISAAGLLDLKTIALKRTREAFDIGGNSRNDVDQAVSDQMGAEGALKAARDAVRIFGKADGEIDRMVRERKIDPVLVVKAPIDGHVTARSAASGLYVQPGNTPAPYTVADLSTKWMLANVVEADAPVFHLGQEVRVTVPAFPNRAFTGRITTIGSTIDANTHRLLVRSEIRDPQNELRPGMLATFVIQAGAPVTAPAVAADAVVHEGDGSDTVWTTTDRRLFKRRVVRTGLRADGFVQILDGVPPGALVVSRNAVFLSNMLVGGAS